MNPDPANAVIPPKTEPPVLDNFNPDFLNGFLSGQDCLIGGSGWWKYEICYGKHVTQFHVKNYLFKKK